MQTEYRRGDWIAPRKRRAIYGRGASKTQLSRTLHAMRHAIASDPNRETAGADILCILCAVLLFLWAVWPGL